MLNSNSEKGGSVKNFITSLKEITANQARINSIIKIIEPELLKSFKSSCASIKAFPALLDPIDIRNREEILAIFVEYVKLLKDSTLSEIIENVRGAKYFDIFNNEIIERSNKKSPPKSGR